MNDTPETENTEAPSVDDPTVVKKYWLDDKRNVRKIFWALVIVCALLFATDLFMHRHTEFGFQKIFGFFGLYGFFLSFILVLTSKELRKILMRDEDYYDR